MRQDKDEMARYRLIAEIDDEEGVVCSFDEVSGFFDSTFEEDGLAGVDFFVHAYQPGDFLRRLLPNSTAKTECVSELQVLGRDNNTIIGRYALFGGYAHLSRNGLSCSAFVAGHRPLPEEEQIWDLYRSGGPQSRNLWARYEPRGRQAWVQVALKRHIRSDGADKPNGWVFELDGTHVTESAGFFCALGEAINGPGGYYGISLGSLSDCMSGGYGTAGGFTLIWKEFHVARRSWRPEGLLDPSMGQVLDLLKRWGVTVERH